MTSQTALCQILLTYKGKILLLQQEDLLHHLENNLWRFIKKIKTKDASAEKTIIQEVHKETRIKLDSVTLLSSVSHEDTIQYLFHAKLSDKHVNNIERGEGRILQFFGLNELNRLQLQPSTKLFFSNERALIEHVSVS